LFGSLGSYGVCWIGDKWIIVGDRTGSLASSIIYSNGYDVSSTSWTGVTGSTSIFPVGYGVAWNGRIAVAVGGGTSYTIAYSSNGITWTGVLGSAGLYTTARAVTWTGKMWIVTGNYNSGSFAFSTDGINWELNTSTVFAGSTGTGVFSNYTVGANVTTSQLALNADSGIQPTQSLEIVAPPYFNASYQNLTTRIENTEYQI
jgi:hypothetical protein